MKQRIEKKSMKPKADSWKRIRTYLDWPRGKNKQTKTKTQITRIRNKKERVVPTLQNKDYKGIP